MDHGLKLAAAFALWVSFCSPAGAGQDLFIFGAASLKEALSAVAKRYERETGVKVVESYAGSGLLARQIEHGAPADLFISADREWMDYLERRGLIRAETRVDLLSNRLVLIVPADSKASLVIRKGFPLAAALGKGRLAMANPDSVPAGRYARAALEALGVWATVSERVVRGENVRTALAYVARGEAPMGIVYRTDALAEPRVRILGEFDPGLHPPIVYPAAVLVRDKSTLAKDALTFLGSPAGRRVWERHGFIVMER